jgi:GT2 family glycosyltransferase
MLRDIGLFDEDFFLRYEDVDLSFRAQLMGYKCLYVPEAVVYHHNGNSIGGEDSPDSIYFSQRNLEWVYIKNMPTRLILRSLPLHFLYNLAAFIFFLSQGHMRPFLRAKIAAFKGLKAALEKRRKIQAQKKVNDGYLWSIMERETFFPRVKRRLEKKCSPHPRHS